MDSIMQKKIITNKNNLNELAKNLSDSLNICDVVFLNGDLGSGKTTFASMIIKHMLNNSIDIKNTDNDRFINVEFTDNEFISSPTFNIVHEYQILKKISQVSKTQIKDDKEDDKEFAKISVWHFDFYRIKNKEELYHVSIDDAVKHGISIVEWPDIARDFWKKNNVIDVDLSFNENDENTREIIIFDNRIYDKKLKN